MISNSVIGAVADLAGGYLKGKHMDLTSHAKQKLERAKIEHRCKGRFKTVLGETAIKASDNSWKDGVVDCLLCPTHRCLLHRCRTTVHRRRESSCKAETRSGCHRILDQKGASGRV